MFTFLSLSIFPYSLYFLLSRASVASGIGSVYKSAGSWTAVDSGKYSKIDLYFNPSNGAYRIISVDLATKNVYHSIIIIDLSFLNF
jgi:hypothetical protein